LQYLPQLGAEARRKFMRIHGPQQNGSDVNWMQVTLVVIALKVGGGIGLIDNHKIHPVGELSQKEIFI
jgi:hypothetical protein